MRLWLMKEAREIETALKALIQVIVNRADKERDILMPGYTHLQVHLCNHTRVSNFRGITQLYSAPNLYGGRTSSYPMLSTSPQIFSVYGSWSLVFPSSLWDREPLPEIPSSWTASSLRRSSGLIPSPRTASMAWAIGTLSSNL